MYKQAQNDLAPVSNQRWAFLFYKIPYNNWYLFYLNPGIAISLDAITPGALRNPNGFAFPQTASICLLIWRANCRSTHQRVGDHHTLMYVYYS